MHRLEGQRTWDEPVVDEPVVDEVPRWPGKLTRTMRLAELAPVQFHGLIQRVARAVQRDVPTRAPGPMSRVFPPSGITHRVVVNVVEMRPMSSPSLRPGPGGAPAREPDNPAIAAAFTRANQIYNRHGLQVVMGTHQTVDGPAARRELDLEEQRLARRPAAERAARPIPTNTAEPGLHTEPLVGRPTDMPENGPQVADEALEILRRHGQRGRVNAFWVPHLAAPDNHDRQGIAVDHSFYRNLRGTPEGFFIQRGAAPETFAHELGHVLMGVAHDDLDDRPPAQDANHNGTDDRNLMEEGGARTGTELTPAQVQRLLTATPYVERVRAPSPAETQQAPPQRATAEHTTPGMSPDQVQSVAEHGIAGASGRLPFVDAICASFGHHDVSDVRVAIGGPAAHAAGALGAHAYASGESIAFAGTPDLFLAAHEAAHVIQQRRGVQLADGIGRAGDEYEQHADRVAATVVRGHSAEALLDAGPGGDPRGGAVPVQRDATVDDAGFGVDVHAAAAAGVGGTGTGLPHLDAIQDSFGHHDVSGVRAHVGGAAADAAAAIGAAAYATGDDVAFTTSPDLRQAAHEAAHVVQQRGGVRLDGGVGTAGDAYEHHADQVAAAVVRGESAEALLDTMAHRGPAGGPAVQREAWDPAASNAIQRLQTVAGLTLHGHAIEHSGTRRTSYGYRNGHSFELRVHGHYAGLLYGGSVSGTERAFDEVIATPGLYDEGQLATARSLRPHIRSEGAVDSINTYDNQKITLAGRGNGEAAELVLRAQRLARQHSITTGDLTTAHALVQRLRAGTPTLRFDVATINQLIGLLSSSLQALVLAKIEDGMLRFYEGRSSPSRGINDVDASRRTAATDQVHSHGLDEVIIGIATHLNIGSPAHFPDPLGAATQANSLYPQDRSRQPRDFEALSRQVAHMIKMRVEHLAGTNPVVQDNPAVWMYQKVSDFNNHFQTALSQDEWGESGAWNTAGRAVPPPARRDRPRPDNIHNFFRIGAAAEVIPCWRQLNSLHASRSRPDGLWLRVDPHTDSSSGRSHAGEYFDFGGHLGGAASAGGGGADGSAGDAPDAGAAGSGAPDAGAAGSGAPDAGAGGAGGQQGSRDSIRDPDGGQMSRTGGGGDGPMCEEPAPGPLQCDDGPDAPVAGAAIHRAAAAGVAGSGTSLPHQDAIQRSFGHHDVSGVRAHVGGAAADAGETIGAAAYATGDDVAFAATPDLRQAAHEAAHVVQQRGGVRLDGGVGRAGDVYEQHADQVAATVVRGESAEALLDTMAHRGPSGGPAVQGDFHTEPLTTPRGEASETYDRAGIAAAPLADLYRAYAMAAPADPAAPVRVGSASVTYQWLRGRVGTVVVRGEIRSKLHALAPAQREAERAAVAAITGDAARVAELRALVEEAVSSTGAGGPVLTDQHSGMQTFLTRRYRSPGHPPGATYTHAATDVTAPSGTGVYAPCDGQVIYSGGGAGYGNMVRILHATPPPTPSGGTGPLESVYAHLSARLVAVGDTVTTGQAIALTGRSSGNESGDSGGVQPFGRGEAHLHMSVIRVPASAVGGRPGGHSSGRERSRGIEPDQWLSELGVSVSAEPIFEMSSTEADDADAAGVARGGVTPVSRLADGAAPLDGEPAVAAAQDGVRDASAPLPHLDRIQEAFGHHDVRGVASSTGGEAGDAARAIGATAYATGERVAFSDAPSLHVAAHEAAHVVQQRHGAAPDGVGPAGDAGERHADAVADAVTAGGSATDLLDQVATGPAPRAAVQRFGGGESDTMRIHGDRAELYRRHGSELDPEVDDGAVIHGGGTPRTPATRAELADELIREAGRQHRSSSSLVPPDYVDGILRDHASHADVETVFSSVLDDAGTRSWEEQMQALENGAPRLLHAVENHWINDPAVSGLDVLGSDAAQYRDFAWDARDYPGSSAGARVPDGPNEGRAGRMARDLGAVRPERRANRGDDAVATESEFNSDAALRDYIAAHLGEVPAFTTAPAGDTAVPSQPGGRQLLDLALESFLRMREAALADGVALVVGAGYRSAATAHHNAEASGNAAAVASYSSHTLGLAVDLDMNSGDPERRTGDMRQVVHMRTSPVHRWMLIRGAGFGWYPYHNEPWHWEYNPPGTRQRIHDLAHGSSGGGGGGDAPAADPGGSAAEPHEAH